MSSESPTKSFLVYLAVWLADQIIKEIRDQDPDTINYVSTLTPKEAKDKARKLLEDFYND